MTGIPELFYPILTRRSKYKKTNDGKNYADYHRYYKEIEDDCQKRCVYCDISLDEMGGEGMQLDHFRPRKIPRFENLINDPNNLVLSCPKCNRLKSDHWPANESSNLTYTEDCGFLDPFEENRKEYYTIEKTGVIQNKKPPAEYIIRLLKLNRMSRRQVRRKRIVDSEIFSCQSKIQNKMEKVMTMINDNSISKSDLQREFQIVSELFVLSRKML